VYHNHILSCVWLEVTNNGCQINQEIKRNLTRDLHHLTPALLSKIQSGTNENKVKEILTSHKLARREEVYSYSDVRQWIWHLRHVTFQERETRILTKTVGTGKSHSPDGKASVSSISQCVQTKLHIASCYTSKTAITFECLTLQSSRQKPTLWSNLLPPFSGLKRKMNTEKWYGHSKTQNQQWDSH
jgi:hypothetical protein